VNGDPIGWFKEDFTVSRFLMARWRWTMTGELEEPEPKASG
jgi:hypothetical protein